MSKKGSFVTVFIFLTLLSLAFFLLMADSHVSAAEPSPEDWPMFRRDLVHTGCCVEGLAPDTNDTDWIFETGSTRWVVSTAVIAGNYVYIGSDNGKLYKLDVRNGAEIWNFTVSSGTGCMAQFWSSPCVDVANNMVLCHASGVHAVNMTTGEQIWHFDTNTREFSSPVVHDGVVFIGTYSQRVYALPQFDPNTDGTISPGEVIWYYEAGEYQNGNHVDGTGGAVSTTLAVHDGKVFGAEQTNFDEGNDYCDYNMFCLPEEDPDGSGVIEHGEIIWKYEIGEHVPIIDTGIPGDNGDCFSSPSVNVGLEQVYIGSRDQYFYAFALEPDGDFLDNDLDGFVDNEGELLWRVPVDNEVFSSPSFHDGVVFFGSGQYNYGGSPGTVYALRESDGSELWSYPNSDGFLSSVLIADGKVFIGSNDEHLYAFDETTGNEVWRYKAEGGSRNAIGSSPSLYKGKIVVGSCNGRIYSFYPQVPNTLPEITLLSPGNGTEVPTPLKLEWEGWDDDEGDLENLSYDVYLDTNESLTTKVSSAQAENYYETGELEDGTTYYWKVVVTDWKDEVESETRSFIVDNSIVINTPPSVYLVSPDDGETIITDSVELEWEGEDEDDDELSYTVYLDTDSEPSTIVFEEEDEEFYDATDLVDGETYYWKVVASDGIDGTESAIWSFTVDIPGEENERPRVLIDSPYDGGQVGGMVKVEGASIDDDGSVVSVEIKIDDGNWQPVSGTTSWSYDWDTTIVEEERGDHSITVRAFDGELHSEEESITVTVDNKQYTYGPDNGGDDDFEIAGVNGYVMVGGGIAAVVGGCAVTFFLVKRREEEDDYEEEDYDYEEEYEYL